MSAQEPRITKGVAYTLREWEVVEAWLKKVGAEFSPYAKQAIREKMERDARGGKRNAAD